MLARSLAWHIPLIPGSTDAFFNRQPGKIYSQKQRRREKRIIKSAQRRGLRAYKKTKGPSNAPENQKMDVPFH